MDFSKVTTPRKENLLIAFMDIQGFLSIGQRLSDPLQMFDLLDGFARIVTRGIREAGGIVVKFIGDACLVVFAEDAVEDGVLALIAVKADCERYLQGRGFPNRLRVTAHFGEAALGLLGVEPDRRLDVLGDSVNVAASLEKTGHRGRLVITAATFRRLGPAGRRRFHKFPEPIVYLAEEAAGG